LAHSDQQFIDVATSVAISGVQIPDLNNLAGEGVLGVNGPSFTEDGMHKRSAVDKRLLNVQKATGKLNFALDTMATKILLCKSVSGSPKAYGVTIAPGAALPVASNFNGKIANMKLVNVTAKYEVIVSAGTFQSPQLVSTILGFLGLCTDIPLCYS
jgi:choline dehydrogenase